MRLAEVALNLEVLRAERAHLLIQAVQAEVERLSAAPALREELMAPAVLVAQVEWLLNMPILLKPPLSPDRQQ